MMKSLMIAVLALSVIQLIEAEQQCVKCTGDGCQSSPQTSPCDDKCFKMVLRKESPDQKDPFIVKGCTSDSVFYRRSCVNKCYEKKKEFGAGKYYMCVYCCTGEKCNGAGSQVYAGLIFYVVSLALSMTLIFVG